MRSSFFTQMHQTTYTHKDEEYRASCSCSWESVPTDRLHYCLVLLEDHEQHVCHERKYPLPT